MATSEKMPTYFADDKTMNIVVNALLTKMEEAVADGGMDPEAWNKFVENLTKGVVEDNSILKKVISVDLLATVLAKGRFITCEVVEGATIEEAVDTPDTETLYLLNDPNVTANNLTIWMYITSKTASGRDIGTWYSLANVDVPEFTTVNTTNPDHVNNIISHIRRGVSDYNSSANVRGYDLVTAKALTKVLIGLGHANKVVVPYEPQGTIGDIVKEPDSNAYYVYQQSPSSDDWAIYTFIKISEEADGYWVKLTDPNVNKEAVDMNNYWSKDELQLIDKDQIIAMVDSAADAVGIDSI